MYQKVLQQVLHGSEGVQNIMDDVIVHGSNVEEHDRRLEKVINILRESGMTLNSQKCEFSMSKLVFMGHVLSDQGIGQAYVKVQAVSEACEPKTAIEERSCLGLVTF
ncbi:Transposon Tf2-6 polyprotein [Mizuhopecten yessoensis]|uniref:Transposon Tf2-6 polyprotein n=1 Tax=Mizuhopecten yessoensis TaxID=6573 RepID=A0A210PIS1_MIZYE|nr:Transposon Tf2-6 polyprotein [Mizuhopecten yessoensis]